MENFTIFAVVTQNRRRMNVRKIARGLGCSPYLVSRWVAQGKLDETGSAGTGWVLRSRSALVEGGGEKDEKLYKIGELADRYGVTVRTVTNWKRKGMVERVYVDEEMVWRLRVRTGYGVRKSLHPVKLGE